MEYAVTFVTVGCDARFIAETMREIIESMIDTWKETIRGMRIQGRFSSNRTMKILNRRD